MKENLSFDMNQMLNVLPGGLLRMALDDELTIVHASDTFYQLIGMDPRKPARLPKSLFKTVYSSDIIYYTQQIAAQKQRKDNQFLLFYRVLQKDGNLKWIMVNGSKTDETYKKNNKVVPIFFCMVLDVSEHMSDYRKLEQELDYHRTILELSRELFFEYVIATDTLSFSELFREVFGKESVIKEFNKRLEKTKLVHSDDLPGLVNTYKSMMNGKKQVGIEFRMITKTGDIAWYICYATIIYDENKNPYKVVGKLSAINTSRKEEVNKAPIVKLDSLTKVYTKDTAEKMIIDSLATQSKESISTLLICDVRNYKGVNEIVRIVDGENILSTIAGILKRLFRTTDIIGRMGLSDFVVYAKDISSEKNAYEMAEYICNEVNKLYSYDFNKKGITISIGVALTKGQEDYTSVLANAKTALVMAKKDNTSSFEIFYPSLSK